MGAELASRYKNCSTPPGKNSGPSIAGRDVSASNGHLRTICRNGMTFFVPVEAPGDRAAFHNERGVYRIHHYAGGAPTIRRARNDSALLDDKSRFLMTPRVVPVANADRFCFVSGGWRIDDTTARDGQLRSQTDKHRITNCRIDDVIFTSVIKHQRSSAIGK